MGYDFIAISTYSTSSKGLIFSIMSSNSDLWRPKRWIFPVVGLHPGPEYQSLFGSDLDHLKKKGFSPVVYKCLLLHTDTVHLWVQIKWDELPPVCKALSRTAIIFNDVNYQQTSKGEHTKRIQVLLVVSDFPYWSWFQSSLTQELTDISQEHQLLRGPCGFNSWLFRAESLHRATG